MSQKTRVCIISPEIIGPHANGGIGTHCYYLAAFLSQQLQQDVTFLYTAKIERRTPAYWDEWFRKYLGVRFVQIPPPGRPAAVPAGFGGLFPQIATQVYEWLRQENFEVCHFQEMLANGFRCFQAKRLGLAFQNTVLTCTTHSSWEWICQAMRSLPQTGCEELQTKFMERYCLEHCDVLISPSQYMLRWIEQERIPTPMPKHVLPYLFDPEIRPVGHRPAADHVIFFGRLEVRKGLLLFLETLLNLDCRYAFGGRKLKVTFLGKSGYTPEGGGLNSIHRYRASFSPAIEVETLTELGQPEALKYLTTHNDALVVMPSLIDNSPYAIIESLQLGLNVIAANSGGIPELFAGADRLFEPKPEALAAKLLAGLNHELPAPAKRYSHETSAGLWREFCERTLPNLPLKLRAAVQRASPPAVSVFLPVPESLPALSRVADLLRAQTCQNFKVTAVAGVGGGPAAPVSAEIQAACRERGWDIWAGEGTPAGNGSTLRPLGPDDGAACAVLIAAGCSPGPQMIERLIQGLEASGVDALTGWLEASGADSAPFVYEPLGPCLEGGIYANLFGAGCLGLWLEDLPREFLALQKLLQPAGIWTHLVRTAVAGKKSDVVPAVLGGFERETLPLTFSNLDYGQIMELVGHFSGNEPGWLRYYFVNAVATEGRVQDLGWKLSQAGQQLRLVDNLKPRRILFKFKRETHRVIKQIKGFCKKD